jgi:hypothetical protein
MIHVLRLASLILVAIVLIPEGSHLFSLISKMRLDKAAYLAAQRAYDGWALFGIVIAAALLSTLALTYVLHQRSEPYLMPLIAFLWIGASQVIFWVYIFPANRATGQWTTLPDDWETLRAAWEYAHAASAILTFLAFIFLIVRASQVL